MRTPILAGNWKMNKTVAEAEALVRAMIDPLVAIEGVDKVFCPPFMAIPAVARLVEGTPIGVGAQDMYWEESGAYTGEISPLMVAEFCRYVIIGHSERREHFGETDETVNNKIRAALQHGLVPIVCVGETLEQRDAGITDAWVSGQVEAALRGIPAEQVAGIIMAYEPIWAIGTGRAATAADAEHICGNVVRATITRLFGQTTADAVRIQYGGSVNSANAAELLAQPNVDGGLVGGASLKAEDFVAVVRAAVPA
ncbi:MAG TPA: triose-phosphate isomerase [Chloroflexi bacterium]|jgi:triosephosphate isomerase|nr:triose-phosphate isomerase [Chloroflexota bacterium]